MSSITQNTAITSEFIRLAPAEKEEKQRSFPKKCALPMQKIQRISGIMQQYCTPWEINPSSTEYNCTVFPIKKVPSGFWSTNQANSLNLIHKYFQQTTIFPQKTHEQIAFDLTRRVEEQSANTGEVLAELIRRSGNRIDKNVSILPLALFQAISQSIHERLQDHRETDYKKLSEFNTTLEQRNQLRIKKYSEYVEETNPLESEKKIQEIADYDRDNWEYVRKIREEHLSNTARISLYKEAIEDFGTLETRLFQNDRISLYKTEVIRDEKSGELLLNGLTNANQFYALRCIEVDDTFKNYRTIGVTIGTDNTVYTPRVGTSFYDSRRSLKKAVKVFFSRCFEINTSVQVTVWTKK